MGATPRDLRGLEKRADRAPRRFKGKHKDPAQGNRNSCISTSWGLLAGKWLRRGRLEGPGGQGSTWATNATVQHTGQHHPGLQPVHGLVKSLVLWGPKHLPCRSSRLHWHGCSWDAMAQMALQSNLAASLPRAALYISGFMSIATYKSEPGAAIIAPQQSNLQGNYQNYPQFKWTFYPFNQ